jgi:hypothetical protein
VTTIQDNHEKGAVVATDRPSASAADTAALTQIGDVGP